MNYLYLHGFASGPSSSKAVYFRDRFAEQGIDLVIPDLNQDDFFNLTITRQIQQCEAILGEKPGPWTILGSSLGGLIAAWLGQSHPTVERLVLLAPAFEFVPHWQQQLGEAQLAQWQQSGAMEVYHHAAKHLGIQSDNPSLPLSYEFWQDASQYAEADLTRPIPTLILHGVGDEVIPIEVSCRYVAQRPWCQLVELQSDHGLIDVLPMLWTYIRNFLN